MDQFVTVRIVQANGLDLSLFQFDYDLTFGVFFINADRTIYGRYGTRSDNVDATRDISMESLGKAMEAALELHRGYPANKALLAGKTGPKPKALTPEKMPGLQGKFGPKVDFEGQVVQSCIHCHQVRDAQRQELRNGRQAFPDEVLYPFPLPEVLGLKLDPDHKARVAEVIRGSQAEKNGFKQGDDLLTLNGQPMISIADVQWVLHMAGEPANIQTVVQRGKQKHNLTLQLAPGWRKPSNIGWRPTSWELRRMAFGGMKMDDLTPEERAKRRLPPTSMALELKHVGQYGEHALAKKAGFVKGDILLSVDGKSSRMTESELLAYIVQQKAKGDQLPATVLRGNQRLNLQIPTQ